MKTADSRKLLPEPSIRTDRACGSPCTPKKAWQRAELPDYVYHREYDVVNDRFYLTFCRVPCTLHSACDISVGVCVIQQNTVSRHTEIKSAVIFFFFIFPPFRTLKSYLCKLSRQHSSGGSSAPVQVDREINLSFSDTPIFFQIKEFSFRPSSQTDISFVTS